MAHDEQRNPHAPDVLERQTSDDGFSEGWGLHMRPAEQYWIDMHTHMLVSDCAATIARLTGEWHDRMVAHRLVRHIGLDGFPENLETFSKASACDPRFQFLLRFNYDKPEPEAVSRAKSLGACGLKLHNAPIMKAGLNPDSYLSEAWNEVFTACAEHHMPVLWHVTQRYSASTYSGGGKMSYWKDQPDYSVDDDSKLIHTNREHLAVFEQCMSTHRTTQFIGAHQLHIGFDHLARLCDAHTNFTYDTSIGCFVRYGDRMFPEDADRIRSHFIQYADRILFGTDCMLGKNVNLNLLSEHFLGHVRYIRELALPDEVLQKVAWANTERLFGLEPVTLNPASWGALRP